MNRYIGVDPGKQGGLAVLDDERVLATAALNKMSVHDVYRFLKAHADEAKAVLERVASSPQMGVKSAFTFGQCYGMLQGCLASAGIAVAETTPAKWQAAFVGRRKKEESQAEHKRNLKAAAQSLFPDQKVTLYTADALLLAAYCRRKRAELF